MAKPKLTMLKPRLQTLDTSRVRTLSGGASWRADKTTNDRGYTYRWQKARARFLSANPLCAYCQRQGRYTAATVVDHITPHRGDADLFWDEANWQALCSPHHDGDKRREERQA